ncbi:uncharacterized protein CPUR_02930 [Claviceps purpurea 20.1]|uniref:Uncharacterized protein n=1 Tax=Claviceps purpurea (strain 20.1) TaxID=1111077 RepID=M1VVB6_CLAP2|nr:uncharacterized protein CPUR_02930 [Claviceps purpurea 20.1]
MNPKYILHLLDPETALLDVQVETRVSQPTQDFPDLSKTVRLGASRIDENIVEVGRGEVPKRVPQSPVDVSLERGEGARQHEWTHQPFKEAESCTKRGQVLITHRHPQSVEGRPDIPDEPRGPQDAIPIPA